MKPPEATQDFTWHPTDFGIQPQPLDGLAVTGPAESAAMIRALLAGTPGPPRDIVILNAAAALLAAGKATAPKEAAALAAATIDSGAANDLLNRLAQRSHQPAS